MTVDVADPSSPIVGFLGKSFQVNDEIYQIADFQYKTSHVLLRLDPNSVDLTEPGVHYAVLRLAACLDPPRRQGPGVLYRARPRGRRLEQQVVPGTAAERHQVRHGPAEVRGSFRNRRMACAA